MSAIISPVLHKRNTELAKNQEEVTAEKLRLVKLLTGKTPAVPERKPHVHVGCTCDQAFEISRHYDDVLENLEEIVGEEWDKKQTSIKTLESSLQVLVGTQPDMPYIESLSSAECQQALCVALQLKNAHSDMSAVLASFANSYQLRNNYAQDQLTVFEKLAVELANKLDGTINYRPGRTEDLTLALQKTEEELVASEQLFKETSLQHSRKVRQLEAELKEARNKSHRMEKEMAHASSTLLKLAAMVAETPASKLPKGHNAAAPTDACTHLKRSVDALSKKLERRQYDAQLDQPASAPSDTDVAAMKKQIAELTEKAAVQEDQLTRLRDNHNCVLIERDKAKDDVENFAKQLTKLRAGKADEKPKKCCK